MYTLALEQNFIFILRGILDNITDLDKLSLNRFNVLMINEVGGFFFSPP